MRVNIKVGPGGIREIEFFVQAFQILKGGRNHRLQLTGIFNCFDALPSRRLLPPRSSKAYAMPIVSCAAWKTASRCSKTSRPTIYPRNRDQQARIAYRAGIFRLAGTVAGELQLHRDRVNHHFTELFKREATSGNALLASITMVSPDRRPAVGFHPRQRIARGTPRSIAG